MRQIKIQKKYRGIAGIIFIASFFAAAFLYAHAALALSAGGLGGRPAYPDAGVEYSDSWFIYSLGPGERKDDAVIVVNHSDETQTLKLYAVDSIATADGNFSLKKEEDPRSDVGAWVTLSQTLVALAPGEEKTVPFTIAIPDGVSVGEHSGGIVIQKAAPDGAVGGTGAAILTRIGIRIYETVPGEIVRDIELTSFTVERKVSPEKGPYYDIILIAKNKSNVTLKPKVKMAIAGWGKSAYFPRLAEGKGLFPDDLIAFFQGQTFEQEGQLLRDQEVLMRWEWPEPAFGHFSFQAAVSFEGERGVRTIATKPVRIWVIPPLEVGALAVLVLALLLLIAFSFLRFGVRGWQPYTVKAGDQLSELAQKAGIDWKKLQKMNKLKTPFVSAGQTLLLPPSFFGKTNTGFSASQKRGEEASGAVAVMPKSRAVKVRVTTEAPKSEAMQRAPVAKKKRAPRKKKDRLPTEDAEV